MSEPTVHELKVIPPYFDAVPLAFCRHDGKPARANAGAPSVLVAYGYDNGDRLQAMREHGAFIVPRKPRCVMRDGHLLVPCRTCGREHRVDTQARPCCDLHGRNCEPPSELCCGDCTEACHGMHECSRGWTTGHHGHPEECSAPDLWRAEVERSGRTA